MNTTEDSQQKPAGEAGVDHEAIAAAGTHRVCHKKAKPTRIPDQDVSQGEGSHGATTSAGPRRVCHKKAKATPILHQKTSQVEGAHGAIAAAGPSRVCRKKTKATPIPDHEPLAGEITSVKAKGVCVKKTKMPKAIHGRCKRHMHAAGSDKFVRGDAKFEDGHA
ncbi:hypothetical protein FIBSPDRAFT_859890 [Athelia psychrophila]|uniref:Uncharacterized protein n=1 Tax=Athelia psychrophila TaxID=1759441 RepID=A0A166KLU5_9AGAM|nr:hypothetical protein FIBSPDRAFT_859890 [Fibularhizoctonia sp. CBS 109695]